MDCGNMHTVHQNEAASWNDICSRWTCDICDQENDKDYQHCVACRRSRSKFKIDEEMISERAKRKTIIMEEWRCEKCMAENDCLVTKCSGCKSSRDYFEQSKRRTLDLSREEQIFCRSQSEQDVSRWTCPNCLIEYIDTMYCENCLLSGEYTIENSLFDNERRIILVGRTGSGKSATGNNILNKDVFLSDVSSSSITRHCKRGKAERFGRIFQVVDTPGLFDTGLDNDTITKEIMKCVGITAPGPHAVLMVIAIGRFTEEEKKTVQTVRKAFGSDINKHMIIIFTRKDDLDIRNKCIDDLLKEAPTHLQDVLNCCGNRYIAWNNNANQDEKEHQAFILHEMIEKMIAENNGQFFQSEIFSETEILINQREQEIRSQFESSFKVTSAHRKHNEALSDGYKVVMRRQPINIPKEAPEASFGDQYMQMSAVPLRPPPEKSEANEPTYLKMEMVRHDSIEPEKNQDKCDNPGSSSHSRRTINCTQFDDTVIYEDLYELREVIRNEVEEGNSSFFANFWGSLKRKMSNVFSSFFSRFRKKSLMEDSEEHVYDEI